MNPDLLPPEMRAALERAQRRQRRILFSGSPDRHMAGGLRRRLAREARQ